MKTLQERINELETPAKFYLQNLYDALAEAIVIPNEMLPEEYRQYKEFDTGSIGSDDGQVYGRTCAELMKRNK
jgi:hypothetical protein